MALGVAALIAIFATTDATVDLTAVRHGWTLVLVAAAATSLVTVAIGRPRRPRADDGRGSEADRRGRKVFWWGSDVTATSARRRIPL